MSFIGTALTRFKYTTIQAVPGPKGGDGSPGTQGVPGQPAPVIGAMASLRSTSPAVPSVLLGGFHALQDGGEGVFTWSPTDPRADDGGTIIQVTGLSSGRWVRADSQGDRWSVRWFGATGDGTTDDAAAINACSIGIQAEISRRGANAVTGASTSYTNLRAHFPRGHYRVSATVEFLCNVEGDDAFIFDLTQNIHLMRLGTAYQKVRGVSFAGGDSQIVLRGQSVHFGSLQNNALTGPILIDECRFFQAKGPAIWEDTQTGGWVGGGGQNLTIRNCASQTGCLTLTNTPTTVDGGNFIWAANPAFGGWPIAVNDDAGHAMGFFNYSGALELRGKVYCVPQTQDVNPRAAWCQGPGDLTIDRSVRLGGESSAVTFRVKANYSWRGRSIALDAQSPLIGPKIKIECEPGSCTRGGSAYTSGGNWAEIYDVFPSALVVNNLSQNAFSGVTPPFTPRNIPLVPLADCLGVFIDSHSCPKSSYLGGDRNFCFIDLGMVALNACRFRTADANGDATAPENPLGEDVTGALLPYMTPHSPPRVSQTQTLGQSKNLWPVNRQDWTAFEFQNSISMTAGSAETATGFLTKPAVAGSGAQLNIGCKNVTLGLPAGLYTISFGVSATVSGVIRADLLNNTTGALVAALGDFTFGASSEFQRIEFPYWHDGATYAVGFAIVQMAAAGQVTPAFFKIEAAPKASAWTTSQAPSADGYVATEYFVAGAAPSTGGPYNRGDIAWNTDFGVSNVDYWRCVGSGSPGSWIVGNTLPFDPSQIPSYSFDYDASLVTPGAITQWPDKAGAFGPGAMTLFGTATAHAAGGSGPSGAAYVQGNGSSDVMRMDASSVTLCTEWFVVAKWNDSGSGTTGAFFDGGTVNQFDVYRNSSTTVFSINGNAGTVTTGDQGAWCVWHFKLVNPGVSGTLTLTVNGHTILSAVSDTNGGLTNGLSLFGRTSPPANAPAYADMFASLSVARIIGFNPGGTGLTGAQETAMAAYFLAQYGVT